MKRNKVIGKRTYVCPVLLCSIFLLLHAPKKDTTSGSLDNNIEIYTSPTATHENEQIIPQEDVTQDILFDDESNSEVDFLELRPFFKDHFHIAHHPEHASKKIIKFLAVEIIAAVSLDVFFGPLFAGSNAIRHASKVSSAVIGKNSSVTRSVLYNVSRRGAVKSSSTTKLYSFSNYQFFIRQPQKQVHRVFSLFQRVFKRSPLSKVGLSFANDAASYLDVEIDPDDE